ncbi:MAG: succinylglutamate desuccinylase/aspartoacylase family protein [Halioglobus sp.]|nr:succinylglutamate desuccinylase/aspartoacylase family protein [Halioglobus sp.]
MYRFLFSDNRFFTVRQMICVCACLSMSSALAQADEAQMGTVQVDEMQIDAPQALPTEEVSVEPVLPEPIAEVKPELTGTEHVATDATLIKEEFDVTRTEPLESSPQPENDILDILGTKIALGQTQRLLWVGGETSYGSKLETPVNVIRGKHSGPTLCLTAAIHGDELNGIEIVRRVVSKLSVKQLHGTVIGVPIVNLLGFTNGTRYLPDRRDLNRHFPGNPKGSSASRIAYSFFQDIVRHCDLLIDLHTGSLARTNIAQVRANLQVPEVLEFTNKFGSTAVLHSRKLRGNLRSAAVNYGIPAVALELGEPGSLQERHIKEGVKIINAVLSGVNMTRPFWATSGLQPVFYSSRWVRVNYGGLLISNVDIGERIWEGTILGAIVNPITDETFEILSPYSGRVLGMALNQFMLPGYAAFNIGIAADKDSAAIEAQNFACIDTDDQVDNELSCSLDDEEQAERQGIEAGEQEEEEDES